MWWLYCWVYLSRRLCALIAFSLDTVGITSPDWAVACSSLQWNHRSMLFPVSRLAQISASTVNLFKRIPGSDSDRCLAEQKGRMVLVKDGVASTDIEQLPSLTWNIGSKGWWHQRFAKHMESRCDKANTCDSIPWINMSFLKRVPHYIHHSDSRQWCHFQLTRSAAGNNHSS